MAEHGFYDAGPLSQVAINLFYGWGYNFYREENHLRADDQLIRGKAGWLLGLALTSVQQAESGYRRDFMGAPTRADPFPEPAVITAAKALEQLGLQIDNLIGRLHAQPAPENDRMTERYRREAEALKALIACDQQLIGQADLLRATVEARTGTWIVENLARVREGLEAIGSTLQARQALLT
jgi:hypothetical protein